MPKTASLTTHTDPSKPAPRTEGHSEMSGQSNQQLPLHEDWEQVHKGNNWETLRMRVPGGWLYLARPESNLNLVSTTFVPDASGRG